jgi:GTP diphosphokinase / guanosine-3',5'-bis(diphosphate) 3'-diphosphatase
MAKLLSSYTANEEADKRLIINDYRSLLRAIGNNVSKNDKKRIRRAFEISAEAHKSMRRKSGEPYILHPIAVAKIVAKEMSLGTTSIICALLHDTVEDTEMTFEDIEMEFGNTCSEIVEGLTKISNVVETKDTTLQAENFKKILLTLADDPRVILIKIADRLHNMRTLESMRQDKQLKISSETTFIYAPIAHRLGLYDIKSELEDLAMKFTEPETYAEIKDKLADTKVERNRFIREFIKPIKDRLDQEGFNYTIASRIKSIHSIYNKIKNKGVLFEEVFDLFAIRIIIKTPEATEHTECWKAYSFITNIYRPNGDRLRDWLSAPKQNGYEALHTTVMGPKGKFVEVQIRSERMNEIAEKGLAAHWKYKDGTDQETKIDEWLRSIREILQTEDSNAIELIADFKTDLFKDEIYCYSPKGRVIVLPHNATALDFAFEIHSELGKNCIGAKVNYKLVPLSSPLHNGDQIEIITSKKQKPSKDWLSFVITAKAKSRIKYYLREEKREIAKEGKVILHRKLKVKGANIDDKNIQRLVKYFGHDSETDLYYEVGKENFDFKTFNTFEFNGGTISTPPKNKPKVTKVIVEEKNDVDIDRKLSSKEFELILFGDQSSNKIDYKLANCCLPIPGDDVFGFVTTSEGLKIHRSTCPNAKSLLAQYGHRVVKAKWAKNKEIAFLTTIKLTGIDDVGVINKITNIISGELKINMRSMSIESSEGIFEGIIKVFVNDKKDLNKLIKNLKTLQGIHTVIREDN